MVYSKEVDAMFGELVYPKLGSITISEKEIHDKKHKVTYYKLRTTEGKLVALDDITPLRISDANNAARVYAHMIRIVFKLKKK
jgi:hypothetical protein